MAQEAEKPNQNVDFEAALRRQQESVARQLESVGKHQPAFWSSSPVAPAAEVQATPTQNCTVLPESSLQALVNREAKEHGISPALLHAVIEKESGNLPCAVSQKGAMGLMQLMPATAQMLQVTDPFDPDQNVSGGSRYLKSLIERYSGDLAKGLAAYNAGPGRVDQADQLPDIPETLQYVKQILANFTQRERRIE